MQESVSNSGSTVVPGIHFAEVRARITLADVLDLLGFVPCESSGDQVRSPCLIHHHDLTIEPELFRESEATYLQMLQMRIVWESTRSVRRSDRAGRLQGDRRVMRAAPSRDPVDAQRNIGPGPDSESIRP